MYYLKLPHVGVAIHIFFDLLVKLRLLQYHLQMRNELEFTSIAELSFSLQKSRASKWRGKSVY